MKGRKVRRQNKNEKITSESVTGSNVSLRANWKERSHLQSDGTQLDTRSQKVEEAHQDLSS